MALLKVQLNHPGNEKPFKIGKGYQNINGKVIREWNDDSKHYRKFIRNEGNFLKSIIDPPLTGKLLFWGNWEGNSVFHLLHDGKSKPNGIHEPIHSKLKWAVKIQIHMSLVISSNMLLALKLEN
jgi:hypothetical protein